MEKIAAILAIVDPTAGDQPAVAKAAILAARCAARLELLVCETGRGPATGAGGTPAPADVERLLEGLAVPLRSRGLEVSAHAITGAPLHEKLLERLCNAPVDLVVKDTHHHSLAKRTVLTNTDWQLIRGCRQSLLLVKPKAWAARPVLVAAVDPAHASDPSAALDHRILDAAASLGARLGGDLHVAHAYFPATIATAAGAGMPPAIGVSAEALRAENDRRRAEIAALCAPYGVSPDRLHVDPGTAVEYLPRIAAECGADVLVMGAIARSALKRLLVGATAERVLESLPCDALVLKPADIGAALPF